MNRTQINPRASNISRRIGVCNAILCLSAMGNSERSISRCSGEEYLQHYPRFVPWSKQRRGNPVAKSLKVPDLTSAGVQSQSNEELSQPSPAAQVDSLMAYVRTLSRT